MTENREARKIAQEKVRQERASQQLSSETETPPPSKEETGFNVRVINNLGGLKGDSYDESVNDFLNFLRTENPNLYFQMEEQTKGGEEKISTAEKLALGAISPVLGPLALFPLFATLAKKGMSEKDKFDFYSKAIGHNYNEVNRDFEILQARGAEEIFAELEQFSVQYGDLENFMSEQGGTEEGLATAQQMAIGLQQQWDEFYTPEVEEIVNTTRDIRARAENLGQQKADLFIDYPEQTKELKENEVLNKFLQLTKGSTRNLDGLTAKQKKEVELLGLRRS